MKQNRLLKHKVHVKARQLAGEWGDFQINHLSLEVKK